MFYTEEDIQPVVDAAISVFGTPGNMSNEPNTSYNVYVETAKFGKIWYGDITGNAESLMQKKNELEKLIGETVVVSTVDWST